MPTMKFDVDQYLRGLLHSIAVSNSHAGTFDQKDEELTSLLSVGSLNHTHQADKLHKNINRLKDDLFQCLQEKQIRYSDDNLHTILLLLEKARKRALETMTCNQFYQCYAIRDLIAETVMVLMDLYRAQRHWMTGGQDAEI